MVIVFCGFEADMTDTDYCSILKRMKRQLTYMIAKEWTDAKEQEMQSLRKNATDSIL